MGGTSYREQETGVGCGAQPVRCRVVADLPPGRALDVAAGEGRNAVWLAEQGWQVRPATFRGCCGTGKKLARERGVEVGGCCADARNPAPRREGYDLVLLSYLQLPPGDWRRALTEAVRAVAPRGRLVSVGHALENLTRGVGGPQDPKVLHIPEDIAMAVAEIAAGEGFAVQVERAGYVTREVATEEGPRTAVDSLVVVHRSA